MGQIMSISGARPVDFAARPPVAGVMPRHTPAGQQLVRAFFACLDDGLLPTPGELVKRGVPGHQRVAWSGRAMGGYMLDGRRARLRAELLSECGFEKHPATGRWH